MNPHEMPHDFVPHIAIVAQNSLEGLGLMGLFQRIVPQCQCSLFASNKAMLEEHENAHFVHFFIDTPSLIEGLSFYQTVPTRTILIVHGQPTDKLVQDFKQIDANQPEKQIVKDLLTRMQHDHGHHPVPSARQTGEQLTMREKQVLALIVKGYINKEIADKLKVQPTTIITHRKNLTQKIGSKAIGALTI
ncbi:MAG: helix-turn-helix transcriptional regulator, partial [Alloprevotella sp.]|nr:helix-turn-helix transcriptional regulator [Alloprevotella sp.]